MVEGSNDEIALAMPLKNLQKTLSKDGIEFEITHGDLTSDIKVTNIVNAVGKCVSDYLSKYKLKNTDILEVVLLLDMDGAYIPDSAIVQSNVHTKPFYNEDKILHQEPEKLKRTHAQKQKYLNRLITLSKICKIPFSVYFVSCNLDHIICGKANLDKQEKRRVAENFESKYSDDTTGFISFFSDPEISTGEDHKESWDFIRQDLNSLKRHSNISIFLSNMQLSSPT